MVPQPGGNYLGRTCAALKMPDGPHHALGEAVYLGTALADLADHDKRLSGIPIDTLNAQPPIIGPKEPMPALPHSPISASTVALACRFETTALAKRASFPSRPRRCPETACPASSFRILPGAADEKGVRSDGLTRILGRYVVRTGP